MEASLVLEGVTKRFGDFVAVNGLDLTIPKGCIYGFLGQNGAGKTTTLRMVMSIFYPDEGRITVLGHPRAEEVKDRLGYLPEEKGLYKKMRAAEMVEYLGRLKGLSPAVARERSRERLNRYGLGAFADHKCEALSKGMQQKVQVIGTLVHDPDLVILDEPFSGLDPVNAEILRSIILDLKREGRTVIFSTHVMEHAEILCDSIFLIHRGRKILDGTLASVKQRGDHGIRIDYDGDGSVLHRLKGVRRINDAGKSAEIFLETGIDPQSILTALVPELRIRRFDLREPSLHDIFVRAVAAEGAHA